MWYHNGETIKIPKAMVVNDITYPKSIFRDTKLLFKLGIKEYIIVRPDSKYYWDGKVTQVETSYKVTDTYAGIPRDIDLLKSQMLNDVKSQLSSKQQVIDWYWARASKGGKAVPSNISDYATTLYAEQVTKEAEINALDTFDKVVAYVPSEWTANPNEEVIA